MIERIGRLFGKKRLKKVKQMLDYANIKTSADKFVATHLIISILFSAFIAFFVYNSYNIVYSAISVGLFLFVYFSTVLMIVSLLAEQRARYVESVLPDVLLLMSSNLRGGITPEEAFLLSARPEFGFVADRIKKVGKKIAAGDSLVDALSGFSKGIRSKLLEQTMQMVLDGINAGGDLSVLLESTANDLKETASIRKEVASMIFVYAIFIFMAACLIAPILYAVSIQLAGVLSELSSSIAMQFLSTKAPAGIKLAASGITGDFLNKFAYVNLLITAIFASFIVALINKGDEKYGIRYIPFFVGVSLALFYLSRILLASFFGGIRVI